MKKIKERSRKRHIYETTFYLLFIIFFSNNYPSPKYELLVRSIFSASLLLYTSLYIIDFKKEEEIRKKAYDQITNDTLKSIRKYELTNNIAITILLAVLPMILSRSSTVYLISVIFLIGFSYANIIIVTLLERKKISKLY